MLAALRRLRFGAVEVTVHDGRIVQIETREKVRVADRRPPESRRRDNDTSAGADRSRGGPRRDAETSE